MNTIRLLVIDDHNLFRAGLVNLLSEMDGLEVVGQADDGADALALVPETKPDVLLLDVNMPGTGGVETVRALRKTSEGGACRILMLTISKSDHDLLGAIAAGADGYLLKSAEPEELERAIHQVAKGQAVLSPEVTRKVLRAAVSDGDRVSDGGLSARELEVLDCLARGLVTSQIARELVISENTVKTHVRHILDKLDASNRAEAVSVGVQLGIISIQDE
jgi:DNA-binding NarL/FixJ family response regulator